MHGYKSKSFKPKKSSALSRTKKKLASKAVNKLESGLEAIEKTFIELGEAGEELKAIALEKINKYFKEISVNKIQQEASVLIETDSKNDNYVKNSLKVFDLSDWHCIDDWIFEATEEPEVVTKNNSTVAVEEVITKTNTITEEPEVVTKTPSEDEKETILTEHTLEVEEVIAKNDIITKESEVVTKTPPYEDSTSVVYPLPENWKIINERVRFNQKENVISIEIDSEAIAFSWQQFLVSDGTITNYKKTKLLTKNNLWYLNIDGSIATAHNLIQKFDFSTEVPKSGIYFNPQTQKITIGVNNRNFASNAIATLAQQKRVTALLSLKPASFFLSYSYEITGNVIKAEERVLLTSLNFGRELTHLDNQKILFPPKPKVEVDVIEISFETLKNDIDLAMRDLGWTTEDGKAYLINKYNKKSRLKLTDTELLEFHRNILSMQQQGVSKK